MTRRKGEQPVVHPVELWTPDHPVARAIATGSGWMDAWIGQRATPIARLAKLSAIAPDRIWHLIQGDAPTAAEIASLAKVWRTTPTDLAASIASDEVTDLNA